MGRRQKKRKGRRKKRRMRKMKGRGGRGRERREGKGCRGVGGRGGAVSMFSAGLFDPLTLPLLPKPPAVAEDSTQSINLWPRPLGVVTPAPPRESLLSQ